MLQKAREARTPQAREKHARRGLATKEPLDPTVKAMLMHQLYMAYYERADFERALDIAQQALAIGELGKFADVCQQNAARAFLALGDVDKAVEHYRLAARNCPASRRAFHLWTLGSVFYLIGRFDEAEEHMGRAVQWGTTDRPLFEAHLALIRVDSGKSVDDLQRVLVSLEESSLGRGYARFLLGMLYVRSGRQADGEQYLRQFVRKVTLGRKAVALSLARELALAEKQLQRAAS